jgi:tRNA 2-selenouridine synthase
MHYLDSREFLGIGKATIIIDVRSPSEYEKGHITGAINLPLFDDEERAVVGIQYKNHGRHEAIEAGLEIAGPKLSALADQAKRIAIDNKICLYCWRGGMRSEKMAWLLELIGLEAYVLQGGYKQYRNALLEGFRALEKLIVLQGATGTGKTDILHELAYRGEQILDLEFHASHKGSAFGHIGMRAQPTSQQFQNNLFEALTQLDIQRRIWVESESLTIGKVYLPETLWSRMNSSHVVELDVPKNIRAARLVEEYGQCSTQELRQSIEKIAARFGGNRVKTALGYLDTGNLYDTALLLLEYYDKTYRHSRNTYKDPLLVRTVQSDTGSPEKNATKLLEIVHEMGL